MSFSRWPPAIRRSRSTRTSLASPGDGTSFAGRTTSRSGRPSSDGPCRRSGRLGTSPSSPTAVRCAKPGILGAASAPFGPTAIGTNASGSANNGRAAEFGVRRQRIKSAARLARERILDGVGLLILSLAIAGLGINLLTAVMIGLGYAVYIGVYTVGLKRTHVSNIVIGGFAGSCPALAGSAAAANSISLQAVLIALLVFLWTPGHFWALAYRSREDYRRARLPMLPAVWDERRSTVAIAGSTAIVALASIAFFFFTSAFDAIYLAVALVLGAALLALTAKFVAHPSADTAWAGYKFSGIYLALLLIGMMADAILRIPL